MISSRALCFILVASLNAPLWSARAGSCDGPRAPLPSTMIIANGVVIAHGNELAPPFTLAMESDSLCIYDGAGRRFASDAAPERAAPGPTLPVPRLLATAATHREATPPEVRLAQIAHLLRGGGALAFGDSYLVAFPPASAAEVLPDLRWIAEHGVLLSGQLPPASPFLRDLMWPARLAPPVKTNAAPGPG